MTTSGSSFSTSPPTSGKKYTYIKDGNVNIINILKDQKNGKLCGYKSAGKTSTAKTCDIPLTQYVNTMKPPKVYVSETPNLTGTYSELSNGYFTRVTCNIISLGVESIYVPPSSTVTVFDTDTFNGNSKVYSEGINNIGPAWRNRIESMIVKIPPPGEKSSS
jgi:hypothetical protein